MSPPHLETARRIFTDALERGTEIRASFVAAECAGDAALLDHVRALLRAHEAAAALGFLDTADAFPADASPAYAAPPAAAATQEFATQPHRGGAPAGPAHAAVLREGPGSRVGPYKLLQLIGEGGFGSVFMAEQQHPVTRRVAVKIIKLGMDTRAVIARFEAERQALAVMDHAHIARVLDAGTTDAGRPYFVMELVRGEPVTEYCDRNKLPIAGRLELFAQVCHAVGHAHQKGIIHRDIKPGNVLVSTQDGRPFAKVIDFGIAKAMSSRLTERTLFTEFRQLIGTPQYMSPEQAEGSLDVDTRADVYSLGVLLYELLTGTTPFDGRELRSAAYDQMLRIIREVEPPKPSTRLSQGADLMAGVAASRGLEPRKLNGAVRGELDWIVMKAMEKDRSRRYDTPGGLADDVRRYLAGEAVLAAPPTATYRLRKFAARHAAALAVAASLLGILGGGVVASTWQALRARRAERTVSAQLGEVEQRRREAQVQRDEAVAANARADAGAARVSEMAAGHCADQGIRAERDGDPGLAMLWFARAVRLDGTRPDAVALHRLRFAVAMRQVPQPVDVVPPDAGGMARNGLSIRTGDRLELIDARTMRPAAGVTNPLYPGPAGYGEFSPDGRYLAAVCGDGRARVFETSTGRLASPPVPHPAGEYLQFTGDGLLVTTDDGKLRLRDPATGRVVRPDLPRGWQRFNKDGRFVVIRAPDETNVYDTRTGARTCPALESLDRGLRVAISPDGRRVAVTGAASQVFDALDGRAVTPRLQLQTAAVNVAEFTPDGRWLLTGGDDVWRVWDAATGAPRAPEFHQSGRAFWAEFSDDGTRVATLTSAPGASVVVRETATGEPFGGSLSRPNLRVHFAEGNHLLLTQTRGTGGVIETWNLDGSSPSGPQFELPGRAAAAAVSPDGETFLTSCKIPIAPVRAWDLRTGQPLMPAVGSGTVSPTWPRDVSFDAGGRQFRVEGRAYDRATGLPAAAAPLPSGPGDGNHRVVGRSTDGTLTLTADGPGLVVHDHRRPEGPGVRLDPAGGQGPVADARFGADGGHVAVLFADNRPALWDARTGESVPLNGSDQAAFPRGAAHADSSVRFGGGGRYVFGHNVTRSTGVLWEISRRPRGPTSTVVGRGRAAPAGPVTRDVVGAEADRNRDSPPAAMGSPSVMFTGFTDVRSAEFAADGGRLLIAGALEVRQWDIGSREFLPGHIPTANPRQPFYQATYSPDGRLILTLDDGGARLWDANTHAAVAYTLAAAGIPGAVDHGWFTPAGDRIITTTKDAATVWNLAVPDAPAAALDVVARYLAGRRLDDDGYVVDDTTPDLRARAITAAPELFRAGPAFSRATGVSPAYREALRVRAAAAATELSGDPSRLAAAFTQAIDVEYMSHLYPEAALLAETAAALQPDNLAAQENVAQSYLLDHRFGEALAIYERFKGRSVRQGANDVPFGHNIASVIGMVRDSGIDDPVLGRIEAMFGPATEPASQPAP